MGLREAMEPSQTPKLLGSYSHRLAGVRPHGGFPLGLGVPHSGHWEGDSQLANSATSSWTPGLSAPL
jgi:hypothetical protein